MVPRHGRRVIYLQQPGWDQPFAKPFEDFLALPDVLLLESSDDSYGVTAGVTSASVGRNGVSSFRLVLGAETVSNTHVFSMAGALPGHPLKTAIRAFTDELTTGIATGAPALSTRGFKAALRQAACRFVLVQTLGTPAQKLAVECLAALAGWSGTTRLYYGNGPKFVREDGREVMASELPPPFDDLKPSIQPLTLKGELLGIAEPCFQAEVKSTFSAGDHEADG